VAEYKISQKEGQEVKIMKKEGVREVCRAISRGI
jgi:hypothetical protein